VRHDAAWCAARLCAEGGPAPSVSPGGEEHKGRKRQGSSSRYIGVCWNKVRSSFQVQLMDPQSKQHIGRYASEEDAARAYDCAAVQAHGPGAERNFPGETVSEAPATLGSRCQLEQVQLVMNVQLKDPQTKREQSIGYFASEEDAARAYDCAAVQAHGAGSKRNFPAEDIREAPATLGEARKQRSSRYIGVTWDKATSSWIVQLYDPQTKRQRRIGSFASEQDAARAYDCAAVQAHGPGAERNFPGDAISELPATVRRKRSAPDLT
jgi:hypothetical protein